MSLSSLVYEVVSGQYVTLNILMQMEQAGLGGITKKII